MESRLPQFLSLSIYFVRAAQVAQGIEESANYGQPPPSLLVRLSLYTPTPIVSRSSGLSPLWILPFNLMRKTNQFRAFFSGLLIPSWL